MSALAPAQGKFDFESKLANFRGRTFLTVREVCGVLVRKEDFVERLIEEQKLHGHGTGLDRTKERKRITPESVALYLAETALYDATALQARLRDLLLALGPADRRQAAQFLATLPGGKP